MQQKLVNRGVLILVLILISALFLNVIKPFLLSIFLAALFAALFTPLYRKILTLVRGRESLAALCTLLCVMTFVFIPMFVLGGAVLGQASDILQIAWPKVAEQLQHPELFTEKLATLPFYEQLLPYRDSLLGILSELTGNLSKAAVGFVQQTTASAFGMLLSSVIVLYTMFFFLMDGDRLLYYLLYYIPLNDTDEKKLLHRFTSVTRATIKGTAVIGVLQGTLAGLALWFVGIPNSLFWAVVMMFMSVVPGIGTAFVWVPAAIYLAVTGNVLQAVGLTVYCVVVVGTVDNLLRPKLVGSDTQLHELYIFFSTLGGLLLFGFMGFIIGPIIAALFVTIWEVYGEEFSDWLPTTVFRPRSQNLELPHQRRSTPVKVKTSKTAASKSATKAAATGHSNKKPAIEKSASQTANKSMKTPSIKPDASPHGD